MGNALIPIWILLGYFTGGFIIATITKITMSRIYNKEKDKEENRELTNTSIIFGLFWPGIILLFITIFLPFKLFSLIK